MINYTSAIQKMLKRICSILITGCLMIPAVPFGVFAADESYVPRAKIANITASSYQDDPSCYPENAVDGVEGVDNYWHTPWTGDQIPDFPHWLQVAFTEPQTIHKIVAVARNANTSNLERYEVWVSETGEESGLQKLTEGTIENRTVDATIEFEAVTVKMVRLVALSKFGTEADNSFSISEIKFGLEEGGAGVYDGRIHSMLARIDAALDYTSQDTGEGAHQFSPAEAAALSDEKATLQNLLGTADTESAQAALDSAGQALERLLASNKAEEESLTVPLPKGFLTAEANSWQSGYEASRAIDGSLSTLWHTQWQPENSPFPHTLSLTLPREMLLDQVYIYPRTDMDTGRIVSGEIWAGADEESLELAASFTGGSSSPTVVELPLTTAKVVQIRALSGNSPNTAVAEVEVYTYDRGYVSLLEAWQAAHTALESAVAGEGLGQYPQSAIDQYAGALEGARDPEEWAALKNSECYAAAAELNTLREEFFENVNIYTLDTLNAYIREGEALLAAAPDASDRAALENALQTARAVASDASADKMSIHEAAASLETILDGIRAANAASLDLSGVWQLKLGSYSSGGNVFDDTANLPGSLDENKKGETNEYADMLRLSRYVKYTGPALYQRDIYLSGGWDGRQITLLMERTRVTRVWVNGVRVDSSDRLMLSTAQKYDLSAALKPGAVNTLTIEVDNDLSSYASQMPAGGILNSHLATEETQTNWNGIVGRFELEADPMVSIDGLRVYPNEDLRSARVVVEVKNATAAAVDEAVTVQVPGFSPASAQAKVQAGETALVEIQYEMQGEIKLWDEFEPNLYNLTARLDDGSEKTVQFGMRRFGVDPDTKQLTINGKKFLLRGEANCAVFPLTGYAPMDEAGWEHLFASYQSFGINTVRFHSWTPPEAAFTVADRMGMYLQPELPCWMGNLFGDTVQREYYKAEAEAVFKAYANHPSFAMYTFGNELSFSTTVIDGMDGIAYADWLIESLQADDPTRLYSFGSNVNFGYKEATEHSDFFTGQSILGSNIRGAFAGPGGHIYNNYPSSTPTYDEGIKKATDAGKAIFSFEVGQFQVFPDVLKEVSEYDGALEPRNLQETLKKLREKGISDETIQTWIEASGMISRIGYRQEIEAVYRTENMSGISLLGIQDFSGQGTALVGMINALGDAKPYDFADPEAFSEFFAPVVPLAVLEKFSWKSEETLHADILLANFGPVDLSGPVEYTLTDGDRVLGAGSLSVTDFPQGATSSAGSLDISLSDVSQPSQLKLTLRHGDRENSYDLWVYPSEQVDMGDVYVAEYLDSTALEVLAGGGSVFLSPPATASNLPNSTSGQYMNAFWSTMFANGTLGAYMDPEHPVFDEFPTEFYSNLQWFPMAKYGRPMLLDEVRDTNGNAIEPLVGVIDGFTSLQQLGLLYEAKVGGGKVIVSSMGLEELQSQYPEAKALRNSILAYMTSDAFDPQTELSIETVNDQIKGEEKLKNFKPNNVALAENGGEPFKSDDTDTFSGDYDHKHADRLYEINDGDVDASWNYRAWTDWNGTEAYPRDAVIGVSFDKDYLIHEIKLTFYEDSGCKAPETVALQYWDGQNFVDIPDMSRTDGFGQGENTISFTPVRTSRIRAILRHAEGMAVAISEFAAYECRVSAEVLVSKKAGKAKYAISNPTSGDKTLDCVMVAYDEKGDILAVERKSSVVVAAGEMFTVDISLPEEYAKIRAFVLDTKKQFIPTPDDDAPGDVDKNGRVTVSDVVALRQQIVASGWSDAELLAADFDGSGTLTVSDVIALREFITKVIG